ncbi:putative DNA-invertase from lambdoid prophage Rac [Raineyella antarctica]|uniref:Putative DNA-invertase from lambdoid prophage Rac n=1 Tax=Raineyella antarctica TaxID=1577474 RepID=A0A1G6IUE5_9ACTN|nr:recombinase family protein [Raineyella antarctica]SDC10202.1 putative DNA-invertase from lambdoid prophage Rac [Raineyella antarctica]
MSDLVYTRVSTDEQSTARQTHLLTAAGLVAGAPGVRKFSDPATSSKTPALKRAGFADLARYARPGDTLTVAELYRLCRDLADILTVRAWCQDHQVKLRVLSGALSGITDLASTDATTTMLVNVLVSVGQFQRDLQNELTRDGLAAARAAGKTLGRPARLTQAGTIDDVRRDYLAGASIAALARQHQVSRAAIRTTLADLLPDRPARPTKTAPPVRVEIPGQIAALLTDHPDLDPSERNALTGGRTTRRGRGYTLTVTAPADIHQTLLGAAATLITTESTPATRKAYRTYTQRVADRAPAPTGA